MKDRQHKPISPTLPLISFCKWFDVYVEQNGTTISLDCDDEDNVPSTSGADLLVFDDVKTQKKAGAVKAVMV